MLNLLSIHVAIVFNVRSNDQVYLEGQSTVESLGFGGKIPGDMQTGLLKPIRAKAIQDSADKKLIKLLLAKDSSFDHYNY